MRARVVSPIEFLVAAAASVVLAYGVVYVDRSLVVVAGAAAVALIVWRPWLTVVVTAIAVSVYGRDAAYWGVGEVGLPLFEPLLSFASLVAVVHLLAREERGESVRLGSVLPWVPAGLWGLALVVGRNHADTVSGIRDATLFLYPLIIALPLATLDRATVRSVIERAGPWIVAIAWYLMIEGISNLLRHKGGETSTGQLRSLPANAGPILVASLLIGVWNLQRGAWSTRAALIACVPVIGLLAVNHRSMYIGFLVAMLVLLLMRRGPEATPNARVRRLGWLAGGLLVLLLVATPVGKQGVDRFASLATGDSNTQARASDTRNALDLHGAQLVIGKGVGVEKTTLSTAAEKDTTGQVTGRLGTHDSFASTINRGGLIGFALLIGTLAWACSVMWRGRRRDPLMLVLLPLAAFMITLAAGNVVMENIYLGLWVWLPVILGLKLLRE